MLFRSAADSFRLFYDSTSQKEQKEAGPTPQPEQPLSPAAPPVKLARKKILPGRSVITSIALVAMAVFLCGGTALHAVASTSLSRLDLSGFSLPEDSSTYGLILESLSGEAAGEELPVGLPALPMTLTLTTYTVVRNDTLEGISKRFGVRLDTLVSLNGISNARRLQAGAKLKIPNMDGVIYTVKKGESLTSIAAAGKLSVMDILDANDLRTQNITPGQTLFLPGARLSSYDLKKALGTLVAWPVNGRISSYFGYRPNPFTGVRQFHNGLDVVVPENSNAKAAMDGRVAETGYSAVFGNFVILNHAGSYQTLYAHLNKILVRTGQTVYQGNAVGLVGSTGYSTGPHLHFGLFRNGTAIDPLSMLGK